MPADPSKDRLMMVGAAILVAVGLVAFALMQQPAPAPPAPMGIATPAPAPETTVGSELPAHGPVAEASATPAPQEAPAVDYTTGSIPDTEGPSPAWESTIDQILKSNVSEEQMARMLIGILPTLPEDGQVEAANHIANLLPDSAYGNVKPLLLNTSLPESVLSVFFTDLMNRDDPTKLNAFLDIAQIPNHPFHDEALSDLQIYVGDDYGTDWTQWKAKVDEYLKAANADQ